MEWWEKEDGGHVAWIGLVSIIVWWVLKIVHDVLVLAVRSQ
jgi:hypothetical protein